MNPAALALLTAAYENYSKKYEYHFSYQYKNANDLLLAVNGAQQLHDDGYIENVSDSIYARSISIVPASIKSFMRSPLLIFYTKRTPQLEGRSKFIELFFFL